MLWDLTPAAGLLLVTAALSLVVSLLALTRSPFPGDRVLSFVMLAVAQWSLFSGLEAAAVSFTLKLLLSKIEYVGLAATPPLFLLFAAKYSGYDRWARGLRCAALWVPAVATVALAATNDLHGWVWAGYVPGPAGSNTFIYLHGPAYYAIAVQVYLFVLAACVLIARSAARDAVRRRQAVTILLASFVPLAGGALYVADPAVIHGIDLIPVSFFVTGLVFLSGIWVFRAFDLIPVARGALIEQMPEAVLVADAEGRVLDANPTASRWLGGTAPLLGRTLSEVFAPWPEFAQAMPQGLAQLTLREEPLLHVDARVAVVSTSGGRPAGCLVVLHDTTERYRNEVMLQRANGQLEQHVRQIEALEGELREQAVRDGLTGLFNRRYLDEILPREIDRASHDAGVVSVVMIDIDHFKATNDRRGHREGDRLLSILGSVLRDGTRPRDAACRYGGEEFLLVLPGAPPDVARARMEGLREDYAARLLAGGFPEPPTLSAGVAVFPEHARTDDELLQAADRALYQAKAEGRDRVCIARAASADRDSP